MKAYTRRLLGGYVATRVVSAPVPAGVVWVVRCADFNPAASGTSFTVEFGYNNQYFFRGVVGVAPAVHSLQWTGRQVVNAGETLFVTSTPGLFYAITGYVLQA